MPEHADSLIESVRTLSRFLVGDESFDEALRRVTDLAVAAVGPADFAGISLPDGDGARTAVFTDIEAPEIDQAQYDTGVGPCLDALRTNQVRRIDSTEQEARWPTFSRTAFDHGVLSTLSLPLAASDRRPIGALNLYSRRPAAFAGQEERHASAFAEQVALVLAKAQQRQPGEPGR